MTKADATKADIAATMLEDGEGLPYGLKLEFSNGQTLQITGPDISTKIATIATWHGLKQKLVDAAALSRDRDTGRAASIDTKFKAVQAVYDRLLADQWTKPREGASNGTLLAQALVRLTSRPLEAVREQLAKLTDEQKAALEKTQNVALEILAIKRERLEREGSDNGDDLLAGFMS